MRSHVTLALLLNALLAISATSAAEPGSRILWQIGTRDDNTAELALGPADGLRFSAVFKQDAVFAVGTSDAKKDWPYVQPGPADAWAGNRAHTFSILFGAGTPAAQGECRLLVDLVDTHPQLAPRLRITINGRPFPVTLPNGASPDSIAGAVAKGRPHHFEVTFPANLLRRGDNSISITTVSGSWLLYDSLALEVPAGTETAPIRNKLTVTGVRGTIFFPRPVAGEQLQQNAQLEVANAGEGTAAEVSILLDGNKVGTQDLGKIEHGSCTRTVRIPEVARPADLKLELRERGRSDPADILETKCEPQKKWKLYCVSYSHHDLGYGNYPHRLRTDIRHANIERPLQFCRETDSWDDDSKYRFVVETSEPITSFLGSHSAADAAELARRIREGRIEIGGVHNTANTEELGTEALARLFYLSGRHTPDLLGVSAGKTVLIDDVVGLTWPLATCCAEADLPWFWHGHNGTATCLQPADAEPVFYWQGPDGRSRVLMRSFDYGGYAGDTLGDGSEAQVERVIERFASGWPYDAVLCQDGTDFQLATIDNARKIRSWNAKYSYPRLICATMDMFFSDVAAQMDAKKVKTFARDANNLWADQDANDAWLLGQAREQGEAIPAVEKFATIASTLTGGGYPWLQIYQAYHRLLAYHEHTNAAMQGVRDRKGAQHYETELVENREMLLESKAFCERAGEHALGRLVNSIATQDESSVVVFNSLSWPRTDLVRLAPEAMKGNTRLVDSVTGQDAPQQRLQDGTIVFVAREVPGIGYKTFRVLRAAGAASQPAEVPPSKDLLENRFYRIRFEPRTGAITSIFDKQLDRELVDASAPQKFNEYLYEHYDSPSFAKSSWDRVESARLSAVVGPVGRTMTVLAAPRGVEQLRQEVTIYERIPRIDFTMQMVKSPSGRTLEDYARAHAKGKEAVYAALPLAIPDFQVHHEVPGATLEPVRQQFAGSCTAFYAVRHFADMSNDRYGVTLASMDAPLVEYGRPRSCAYAGGEKDYESVLEYPGKSWMYLYLMNNMFDTNVRIDQRGPMCFRWSLRSHQGDWRKGRASQFGWETLNPLVAKVAAGSHPGTLPANQGTFVSIDQPNVVCTTIKPAEANGPGLILRFNETEGAETTATVRLPFFEKITAATETSLVETDRPVPLRITGESAVAFSIAPFGIKTIRIISRRDGVLPAPGDLKALPRSDMEVELSWAMDIRAAAELDHYNVYRGDKPDFRPSLLQLVGRVSATSWIDHPQLNYGGWVNNRLEPGTTYCYRLTAVDRWNNESPASDAVAATTFQTAERNALPLAVEALRVVLVSDVAAENYLNLLWRTNCESDVTRYEIFRSTEASFVPADSNRIGTVDAEAIVKGSTDYGHTPIDRRLNEYDHQMYADDKVQRNTTYYYRVCAVDRAGQRGPYSAEATGRTKPAGR